MKAPSEFKILFQDEGQFPKNLTAIVSVVNEVWAKHGDVIHVIEYSAYDSLKREVERLKKSCHHNMVTFIRKGKEITHCARCLQRYHEIEKVGR